MMTVKGGKGVKSRGVERQRRSSWGLVIEEAGKEDVR